MYAFKPEQSTRVSISLCGSEYDTVLALFSKADNWSAVAETACNDDSDCGPQSYVAVRLMTSCVLKQRVTSLQQVTFICKLPMWWHILSAWKPLPGGICMVVRFAHKDRKWAK